MKTSKTHSKKENQINGVNHLMKGWAAVVATIAFAQRVEIQ